MRGARISPRLAWAAFALACCGPPQPQPSATAHATTATGPRPAAAPEPASPWRYAPALTASVPPGLQVEPVLELADGLHGRARVVVAVAEAANPARLEVWDFSQNNEKGLLTRVGEPQILLALSGSQQADARWDREAAAALRREIAGPGNETVRPLGLPGEPATLLPELARLAGSCDQGDAAARAKALAGFTRGLDDRLLWERLPELLQRLRGPAWTLDPPVPLGARRMQISAHDGERRVQLELARNAKDRWVLTEMREQLEPEPQPPSAPSSTAAPAADPSPTAP